MPNGANVLDIGCGNGYSTIKVTRELPGLHFYGIDYSEEMIKNAQILLRSHPVLKERVTFKVGDAMDIQQAYGDLTFDAILTDRCLINLDSAQSQSYAICQIAKHTKAGGYYIAIENFMEGQNGMNKARRTMGLPEIPVRWHNLYFTERGFRRSVEPFFEDVTFSHFSSSYYYATRVIYSAMCQMRGEKPDYNHEIHQLAIRLPAMGRFSPIRMAIMRRKSV